MVPVMLVAIAQNRRNFVIVKKVLKQNFVRLAAVLDPNDYHHPRPTPSH